MPLAWGSKVSPYFSQEVISMCARLEIPNPSWMMACMAFETGHRFTADVKNAAGSGAVGLIQFMPSTAAALGTTVETLSAMTAEDQLYWVEKYFHPWRGMLKSLGDVYGVILWPGMIGKPDDAVIFDESDPNHPKLYVQNKGLDLNKDGKITKAEIVARVQQEYDRGMTLANSSDIQQEEKGIA